MTAMSTATPQATMRQIWTILERGDWTALEVHPGMGDTRQHFPGVGAVYVGGDRSRGRWPCRTALGLAGLDEPPPSTGCNYSTTAPRKLITLGLHRTALQALNKEVWQLLKP
jgi:hypothetical protein